MIIEKVKMVILARADSEKRFCGRRGAARVNLSTIFSVHSRFMNVHQMMINHFTRNTQVEWAFLEGPASDWVSDASLMVDVVA
jgi:hypothetical protein